MELIPHQGISIVSILRGIIGLSSIILIAYLLSNNKRNIDWKTIIIGISSQFVIAIAVLKVDFVRIIFEKIGQGFLAIVTYTNQGSRILFGELADSSKYGEIFIFQVLPVIIFFSALTSVLYYYRIIQKIVSGLAWMLTKLLNISGQESLAVAGNIFLGQTEANGTRDGIKMAVNVGAMLLVFLALIALVNGVLFQLAEVFGLNLWIEQNTIYSSLSLDLILGFLFAPLMWLIGVAKEDITLMGQLLGVKLAASEFVAYIELASLKDITSAMYLSYQKSVIMATIMLCGFANFASIGIQIGGIGILAPGKSKLLTELGFKAMLAGTLVSLLSATFVGMLLG